MMDLDKLFKHGQEFARYTFDAVGEITPMWVAITKDEEILPILVPEFPNKDMVVAALKEIFQDRKVVRYVQMLEGWMVVGKDQSDADQAMRYLKEGGSLADHPQRVEVLTIEASDGTRSMFGHYRILRPTGEPPRLSAFEPGGGSGEGRFANLLGKATRH